MAATGRERPIKNPDYGRQRPNAAPDVSRLDQPKRVELRAKPKVPHFFEVMTNAVYDCSGVDHFCTTLSERAGPEGAGRSAVDSRKINTLEIQHLSRRPSQNTRRNI